METVYDLESRNRHDAIRLIAENYGCKQSQVELMEIVEQEGI